MDWQPIETAPKDGTWFLVCCGDEGPESYCHAEFVPVADGLYRRNLIEYTEWRGFNNFHRMTHWQHLPMPPKAALALSPSRQSSE